MIGWIIMIPVGGIAILIILFAAGVFEKKEEPAAPPDPARQQYTRITHFQTGHFFEAHAAGKLDIENNFDDKGILLGHSEAVHKGYNFLSMMELEAM